MNWFKILTDNPLKQMKGIGSLLKLKRDSLAYIKQQIEKDAPKLQDAVSFLIDTIETSRPNPSQKIAGDYKTVVDSLLLLLQTISTPPDDSSFENIIKKVMKTITPIDTIAEKEFNKQMKSSGDDTEMDPFWKFFFKILNVVYYSVDFLDQYTAKHIAVVTDENQYSQNMLSPFLITLKKADSSAESIEAVILDIKTFLDQTLGTIKSSLDGIETIAPNISKESVLNFINLLLHHFGSFIDDIKESTQKIHDNYKIMQDFVEDLHTQGKAGLDFTNQITKMADLTDSLLKDNVLKNLQKQQTKELEEVTADSKVNQFGKRQDVSSSSRDDTKSKRRKKNRSMQD